MQERALHDAPYEIPWDVSRGSCTYLIIPVRLSHTGTALHLFLVSSVGRTGGC